MEKINLGILGGGLAGLSLAHFIDEKSLIVFEKDEEFGGLSRTLKYEENTFVDIGPHIVFSKDKEILEFMISLTEMNQIRRSNMVIYKGKKIQYPFENFLGMLPDKEEIDFAVNSFINNPYKEYPIENMLQFFLSKFGEGITRMYLQPYNEKIWKFDPSFMDTQMVDRIPSPPKEDIIDGSKGQYKEGYLHQLYFYYPKNGGVQSLVQGLADKVKEIKGKAVLKLSHNIQSVTQKNGNWIVETSKGTYECKNIINCMPIHEFIKILNIPKKEELIEIIKPLRYNSIMLFTVGVKKDLSGDHYAFNIPDKNILFHRISKIDFLGESYKSKNKDVKATFLIEVTFKEGDYYDSLTEDVLKDKIVEGLEKIKFIQHKEEVVFNYLHIEKYAYVIYDLKHKFTQNKMLKYLEDNFNIHSVGRFAQFLYLNMDQVIHESKELAKKLKI